MEKESGIIDKLKKVVHTSSAFHLTQTASQANFIISSFYDQKQSGKPGYKSLLKTAEAEVSSYIKRRKGPKPLIISFLLATFLLFAVLFSFFYFLDSNLVFLAISGGVAFFSLVSYLFVISYYNNNTEIFTGRLSQMLVLLRELGEFND